MIKKLFIFLLSLLLSFTSAAQETSIDFRYNGIYLNHISISQLEKLYKDYQYKDYLYMPEWKYPPIFLQSMPTDFTSITDKQKRNKLFLQILVPLSLRLNEEISAERQTVIETIEAFNKHHNLSQAQIKQLEDKAVKYDIFTKLKGERRYKFLLEHLKQKVDNVPPSLLIAAAAIESDWGTNRPVNKANSLYRELVWNTTDGLEPLAETEDKSYRYKKFDSLFDSMKSFALHLNSNINFEMFRTRRAQIKSKDVPVLGRDIAHTLNAASNLQNFAGILDYTITFYELTNIDEAELFAMRLPKSKD